MTDYVETIGKLAVHVIAQSEANIDVILKLGGIANVGTGIWRIDYDNEDQLAQILQRLRDADMLFADCPHGWPPAGVAEFLREKGKIKGEIRTIVWEGPGQELYFRK